MSAVEVLLAPHVFFQVTEDTFVVRRVLDDETPAEASQALADDLVGLMRDAIAGGGPTRVVADIVVDPCQHRCWCGEPCRTVTFPRHGEAFHGCTAVHAEEWMQRSRHPEAHAHPIECLPGARPCSKGGCLGHQRQPMP